MNLSKNNIQNKTNSDLLTKKSFCLNRSLQFLLILVIFISVTLSSLITPLSAVQSGDSYPEYPFGIWNIDEDTRVEGQNILLNASIAISNGNVEFIDCTLRFNGNSTNTGLNLNAYAAEGCETSLFFENCVITAEDPQYPFAFLLYPVGRQNCGSPSATFANCTFENAAQGIGGVADSEHPFLIEDCTFIDNEIGISLWDSADITIQNCTFRNNDYSISILRSNNTKIFRNHFEDNSDDAVDLVNCRSSVFANNSLSGCAKKGLSLSSSNNSIVENNTITDCESAGIFIGGSTLNSEAEANLNVIRNNIIEDCTSNALLVQYSSENQIINNTLDGNTIYSIHFVGAKSNNVSGNAISYCLQYALYLGVNSTANVIEFNEFRHDTGYAIRMDCSSRDNTYTGNTFAFCGGEILEPENCESDPDNDIPGFNLVFLGVVGLITIISLGKKVRSKR